MASVPNVGRQFESGESFLMYLETLEFKSWRPKYLVMHHTASPSLKDWTNWQGRVSDSQWMKNLASYYGNTMGWSRAPHFFVTPKYISVLSPPTERGVHAASFNGSSWGMEVTGLFDSEEFVGPIREKALDALAACHLAMGWEPSGFVRGSSGLHFHRDDPRTSKTCPGKKIQKDTLIPLIQSRMLKLGDDGDEDDEVIVAPQPPREPPKDGDSDVPEGVVRVAEGDALNLRELASARSPVITTLPNGMRVAILGEAQNGSTQWLRVWLRLPTHEAFAGWVNGKFIERV